MTRAMNLIFLFLVTMAFLIMAMSPSVSACGGCQFDLDPADDGAADAAKYAVSLLFPSDKTSIEIIKATGQVVCGMLYDLNVIVTFAEDGTRSLHNFEVVAITLRGKASPYTLIGYKTLYLHEEKSD